MPESFDELIAWLPKSHQDALKWFRDHAGSEQPWPEPLVDGTLLVIKPKGIYKPKDWDYALSVREALNGPYADQKPEQHPDGRWTYRYFQENLDPAALEREYTNRAMLACIRDRVPVGVMRQISTAPKIRYKVLGIALVASWQDGYFQLEGFAPDGATPVVNASQQVVQLENASSSELSNAGEFDPSGVTDARMRTMASIVRRRGQPKFRKDLLEIFDGRCPVTGCDATEALEAAHIVPYMGDDTNHPSNGLLLRSDIHTLFDMGRLTIDPETLEMLLSPELEGTAYASLKGRRISLPDATSLDALAQHRRWAGL
jgi:hypothetical protein